MPQKIPYCSRPWTSLMLYPDRAGAECSLSYRLNCPTNGRKFDEIWNSEQLKNIRRSILEDRAEILGCGDCEHYGSGLKFYDELTILCNSTKAQRNLRFNREEFLAGNIYLASKPLSISADLCYKCNFRCIMCDLIHDAKEMDSGNLTTLFKVLTNTAVHLHVSGGEPLMHKGFVQYLTSPVAIPSVLSITTNGSLLNKNVLEELKKFPNVNLHISIDSFNLEVF